MQHTLQFPTHKMKGKKGQRKQTDINITKNRMESSNEKKKRKERSPKHKCKQCSQ